MVERAIRLHRMNTGATELRAYNRRLVVRPIVDDKVMLSSNFCFRFIFRRRPANQLLGSILPLICVGAITTLHETNIKASCNC